MRCCAAAADWQPATLSSTRRRTTPQFCAPLALQPWPEGKPEVLGGWCRVTPFHRVFAKGRLTSELLRPFRQTASRISLAPRLTCRSAPCPTSLRRWGSTSGSRPRSRTTRSQTFAAGASSGGSTRPRTRRRGSSSAQPPLAQPLPTAVDAACLSGLLCVPQVHRARACGVLRQGFRLGRHVVDAQPECVACSVRRAPSPSLA